MPHTPTTLTPLGEKIFLDRYAMKEADRTKLKPGDTLLVTVKDHPKWPVRAVAKAVVVDSDFESVLAEFVHPETGEIAYQRFQTRNVDICKETIDDATHRVARGLASVETDREYWTSLFHSALEDFKVVPGGRIYTGAGSDLNVTFFNCYVLPSPKDNRGGIFHRLGQMAEVLARGGGVGINFSTLRPRNAMILGTMGRSSGSVSWANIYSHTISNTSQGGSRRGAGMAQWEIWHPDVMEVIDCKRTPGFMEGFNISLRLSHSFMHAVQNDTDWVFHFPDTKHPAYDEEWDGDMNAWISKGYPVIEYQRVRARDLWRKIMESNWASAEPGVVFSDIMEDESNSYYFARVICTNPCGEQPLPPWAVCTLGHINLARHVAGEIGKAEVDWDQLKKSVYLGVRMLDNVIDATPYFFQENEDRQKSERRIGLGTLGLGEMLIRLGIRYGDNERCNAFLDELYAKIALWSYEASIDLAKEKGAFPEFVAEKFLESGFVKRLVKRFPHLKDLILKYGIRNVTLITQAPTGTVGTMVNTSTGIEPFFALVFRRQSRLGVDKQYMGIAQEYMSVHPGEELPDYFVGAMDITGRDHLIAQSNVQRWTDSACSKTCNLPNSATVEDVEAAYFLAYELKLKGFTIYRDGSRYEQVLHVADESDGGDVTIENEPAMPEPVQVIAQPKPMSEEEQAALVQGDCKT